MFHELITVTAIGYRYRNNCLVNFQGNDDTLTKNVKHEYLSEISYRAMRFTEYGVAKAGIIAQVWEVDRTRNQNAEVFFLACLTELRTVVVLLCD